MYSITYSERDVTLIHYHDDGATTTKVYKPEKVKDFLNKEYNELVCSYLATQFLIYWDELFKSLNQEIIKEIYDNVRIY